MIAVRTALTEAQQAAVDHLQGPLLIVAGAGTGKTRVLVERYRRLRQEGVPAERILLLTFTEKAAREVLDRVEQEDYLPAGERFILTYHAFAQRFLQEDGWLCGIPKGFRIVSEVRKWELMRDVLLAQRPTHLFHAQRPFERIGELLKLVERAKQELVSPAEFQAWADANAEVDDPVVLAQREAATVYAAYQARMLAEDRLDFDDTIFFTVQLLTAQPALAARPGRIDLAIELPLPDAEGRRRLLELYSRGLQLSGVNLDALGERIEGRSGKDGLGPGALCRHAAKDG